MSIEEDVKQGTLLELKRGEFLTVQNTEDKLDTHRCSRLRLKVLSVNRASFKCEIIGMNPMREGLKTTLLRKKYWGKFKTYEKREVPTFTIPKEKHYRSIEDVISDMTCSVKLRCTRSHDIIVQKNPLPYPKTRIFYKKGDILPRNKIFMDSDKWELSNESVVIAV